MNTETAPHLRPTWNDRGFLFLPPIPSTYGGHVSVSESSGASDAYIWLRAEAPANLNEPDGPKVEVPIHLTVDDAAKLIEQLDLLISWHYQLADPGDRADMKRTEWAGGGPVD